MKIICIQIICKKVAFPFLFHKHNYLRMKKKHAWKPLCMISGEYEIEKKLSNTFFS